MSSTTVRDVAVRALAAGIAALVLPSTTTAAQRAPAARLAIPVTDTASVIERRIAPGLHLVVRGDAAGWDVAVVARRPHGENLLYHSREWHGPYPTQLSAWAEAERYFGVGERVLPVRGRPWVVRLRCDGCRTAGTGDTARFTAGVLRVAWERARPTARGAVVDR